MVWACVAMLGIGFGSWVPKRVWNAERQSLAGALSGRLKFTVRRHKFNQDSLSCRTVLARAAPRALERLGGACPGTSPYPNPGTRNPKPENRKPKPETRNPRPKTRNPKPETRNPKPETQNPKPETRIRNSGSPNFARRETRRRAVCSPYRGTSLKRKRPTPGTNIEP